jgi:type III restriction enzyme
MQVELKPFQVTASHTVLDELAEARASVSKGKVQAVVVSAPTGSGKTITVAAVIDQTFGGGDGVPARPDSLFLWLSDSPELNVQSKDKLLSACDHLPFTHIITIESDSFDEERLQPGYLYFINTQLLGKDKRLTQGGDKRQFTFWQTVANTVAQSPEDLVLIIDEAHRGAAANDRNRTPIMQKFILGSEQDGLPPVPLVLGMSATPQRFTALLGNTNRTQRPIVITPEDVRSSGLLKDMIIVHNPRTKVRSDLTLLEHAAKRWKHFSLLWKRYCEKEKEKETVRPILVVQVEDGTDKVLTRTKLDDVVRVIERQSGPLSVNEIVHCFHDRADIEAGGRIIRKIDASRIQDDPDVKVVLFKTALNTGWDCPRAEVMMSFRRAQDPTSIAQLVGRMIRTPLARRIESDEVLNTVELFLPHFDAETLEGVVARLRNPEVDEGVPTRVEMAAVEYPRNPTMEGVFDHLKSLTTYSIARVPRMGDVKRALRLAGLLVHEGVDKNADDELRKILTQRLKDLRDKYGVQDPTWATVAKQVREVEVDVTQIVVGEMSIPGRKSMRMNLSEENIDQLFDATGRMLAVGEGLHRSYWKRYHDHQKPNEAKLELVAVMRNPDSLVEMDKFALVQFERLWKEHKAEIQKLPAADRARFSALVQASGRPVEQSWELPDQIVEKLAGVVLKDHLYCSAEGTFRAELNSWEKPFLQHAMQEKGFVGWLRNLPRKDWAFCIPYELAGTKPFYPDFIIVRKKGTTFEIDVLEPHDDSRTDTWAKAKGLAAFADDHGMAFGRLLIGRKVGKQLQIADMNDPTTREKARKMGSPNDLESLFK